MKTNARDLVAVGRASLILIAAETLFSGLARRWVGYSIGIRLEAPDPMYNPPHFTSTDPTWLDWLAEHHPFGTLVSQVERSVRSTPAGPL